MPILGSCILVRVAEDFLRHSPFPFSVFHVVFCPFMEAVGRGIVFFSSCFVFFWWCGCGWQFLPSDILMHWGVFGVLIHLFALILRLAEICFDRHVLNFDVILAICLWGFGESADPRGRVVQGPLLPPLPPPPPRASSPNRGSNRRFSSSFIVFFASEEVQRLGAELGWPRDPKWFF